MKILLVVLLNMFYMSQVSAANELSLMIIKSPGLNWSSPRTLTKSTFGNVLKTYGLGHVNIKISCEPTETTPPRQVLTGLYTRWTNETKDAVLKQGHGLGVLFKLFEGMIQTQDIEKSFKKMVADGRTNFITFKINASTCQRLLNYYDDYIIIMKQRQSIVRENRFKPKPHEQLYYGFPAMARYGEGAGCSGFGISFLEVAGIKEQWMVDAWTQFFRVPEGTVGEPLRPASVSFRSLFFSGPKHWATEAEPHFPLFFWDPDKMYVDINAKIASGEYEVASLYGSKGIVIDQTTAPTPQEPIFVNEPLTTPSNPTLIYKDLEELNRRYEFTKLINL